MQIERWVGMFVSAIAAFVIGHLYDQPLHWYLFILMLVLGVFINLVIIILKAEEDSV
ncbi:MULTISPECIES: hypothetical protein [unclassified Lysinibacillus]|uniref:hypothetical protein n=1 Tax=unclassified Lysinibacillus TaxID=2636778 RepID=UPI0036E31545